MSDDLETPLTAVRLEKRDALVVVEERVGFLPIETPLTDALSQL
jgi:hypothetical protein